MLVCESGPNVADRNDERTSAASQVTHLQRENEAVRNKSAINRTSTFSCGLRRICPRKGSAYSHRENGQWTMENGPASKNPEPFSIVHCPFSQFFFGRFAPRI
jgi:hypothetical protein